MAYDANLLWSVRIYYVVSDFVSIKSRIYVTKDLWWDTCCWMCVFITSLCYYLFRQRSVVHKSQGSCFLSHDIIRYWLHFWAYLFRIHELNVHCVFHRAGVFNTFFVSGCQTASANYYVFWHLAHASETRTCIYFRYCFVSYTIYVFRGTMFITITKTVVSYHRILTSVIGCTSGCICFAYMN